MIDETATDETKGTTMPDTIDRPAASDAGALAIHAEEAHAAHNYHPLPVVVASGQGAWVTDSTAAACSTASPPTRP